MQLKKLAARAHSLDVVRRKDKERAREGISFYVFFAFSAVNKVGVRSGTAKNARNAKDTVDTGNEIVSFVSLFCGSEVGADLLISSLPRVFLW